VGPVTYWWTMIKHLHSLATRLTLWYAGIFSLCFLAVFTVFYVIIQSQFHRWTDAELREELLEVKMAYDEDGLPGVVGQLRKEEASEGGRFLGRLIDGHGQVSFETAPGHWARVLVNQELVTKARSGKEEVEQPWIKGNHKARVMYSALPDGSVIQVGLTLLDHELWMMEFSEGLIKVAFLALALSVAAGGFMAQRALLPIQMMARTASTISGRSLGQRVPISDRGDEVDQLATSFNEMLERIDVLVQGLQDVTDSLAHDLRTPMTGIRGLAEVTLRSRRDPEAYQAALSQIIEQVDRLLALSNSILDVGEAESGALVLCFEPVALDDLADEIALTFEPVAIDRGIKLETDIAQGLKTRGDAARLGQVLANLLDNAIKYTPAGGRIRLLVGLAPDHEGIAITVADTGIGVSEKDLPHIFERYYRGDKSRSGPGVGLGLPLVQGIVKAHGGHVSVESRPGEGAVFHVVLPFSPEN
jgi:heavy metal sensor kinase